MTVFINFIQEISYIFSRINFQTVFMQQISLWKLRNCCLPNKLKKFFQKSKHNRWLVKNMSSFPLKEYDFREI